MLQSTLRANTPPTWSKTPAYSWLIISLCALFLLYKYILQVSPSVMTQPLMQTFHVNGAGLGNLAASYFYAYFVVQLLAGPLLDRFSLRYLTSAALFSCAIGTLGFASAHHLWLAALSRALIGAGAAFATVAYMKSAAIWFKPQQFALVSGLLATAAMTGALFGETPLALLVEHTGWRNSLYICSMLGLLIALAFVCIARDKPAEKSSLSTLHTPTLTDMLQVLKNKNNWSLTFYSGLAFSPLSVLGGLWGNAFLETAYHIKAIQATNLTSLMFIGLALGSPLLGWYSDRRQQRFSIMRGGLVLSLIALLTVLYMSYFNIWLLGTALFFFGFGTGAFMLGFAVGKESNPAFLAATVIALINTGDAIFSGFTEPLSGKLLDLFWNGKMQHHAPVFSLHAYHWALSVLPMYLLLAWGCLEMVNKTIFYRAP